MIRLGTQNVISKRRKNLIKRHTLQAFRGVAPKMLRGEVLLVSRNPYVRQGLRQALAKDTLSVAGELASAEVALSVLQSRSQHVDVIVYDADVCDQPADLRAIVDQYPQIGIVRLTSAPDSFDYEQAAEVAAKAVLPNSVSAEALNLALQLVILGENLFLATGQPSGGMKHPSRPPKPTKVSFVLSPRETEILKSIKTGAPNKIIARDLELAEATVKVHVKSLLRKIGVGNRTQAAIWAINHLDESDPRAA
jgi:two-component system, NarL family, nitrate/nitrite response regulator NarL